MGAEVTDMVINLSTYEIRKRKCVEIQTVELWPGHKATCFTVRKWRPIYGYFNRLFARSSWRHEFRIDIDWYWWNN